MLLTSSVDVLIFKNPKIKSWKIINNEIGIILYIVVNFGLHLQIWDYDVNEYDKIW